MLSLLADILHRGRLSIVPVSHGGNLNPPVSNALSRDELLIKLRLGLRLLDGLDKRLLIPKAPVHVKLFGLDDVVLLAAQ